MNRLELMRMAFLNLWRRKTRSVLSIIGVVIGTCSIVLMFSLGLGLSAQSRKQVESYGNIHIVRVSSFGRYGGGMMFGEEAPQTGGKKVDLLNDKKVAEFEKIKGVEMVTPVETGYLTIVLGKKVMQTQLTAIRPEAMSKLGYETQEGRIMEAGDKNVLVFGKATTSNFYDPRKSRYANYSFGPNAPKGEDVVTDKLMVTADQNYGRRQRSTPGADAKPPKYALLKVKGIGVLKEYNDERGYNVYTTLDFFRKIREDAIKAEKAVNLKYSNFNDPAKKGYNEIWVYVKNIDEVKKISDLIKKQGYQTSSLQDWLEQTQKQMAIIQAVFGGIGAVSLLVAALGITNTMIMSIYERTREIGVMKVIGANLIDIRNLFLTEAALIGLIGGGCGGLLSLGGSFLINRFLGAKLSMGFGGMGMGMGMDGSAAPQISLVPWWLVLMALVVTAVIGVLSGYYPARRAMRLSALESLRNE